MATAYISPVTGTWAANSSNYFGAVRGAKGRHHAGNDLQAAAGSDAVAVIGGKVQYVGNNSGYNWNAVVLGDDGNAYRYATHAGISVKVGQRVEQGQKIGTIGGAKYPNGTTAPHLHFEVIPPTSPAYKAIKANPGLFVPTSWFGQRKPTTIDPSKFFGVEKGTKITIGKPVGDASLSEKLDEPPLQDPFGVADFQSAIHQAVGLPYPRLRPDYDPNNPRNLRPPGNIPSASDLARAAGGRAALEARAAILAKQPAGERAGAAEAAAVGTRTGKDEARGVPAPGIPIPKARPALLAAQAAILGERQLLKKGSSGAAIREVQKFLNDNGFKDAKGRTLRLDGDLGVRTKQAIMAYQEANGLKRDGIVGIKTLARMATDAEGNVRAQSPELGGDRFTDITEAGIEAAKQTVRDAYGRTQSPEMGGDRFNVEALVSGQPAGATVAGAGGVAPAAAMGTGLALSLAGGAPLAPVGVPVDPSGVHFSAADPFDPLGISAMTTSGAADAITAAAAGAGAGSVKTLAGSPDAWNFRADPSSGAAWQSYDASYRTGPASAESLRLEADLTPSLSSADPLRGATTLGGTIAGAGGAGSIAEVSRAFGRTNREMAAARAAAQTRQIPFLQPFQVASLDPFSDFAAIQAADAAANAANMNSYNEAVAAANMNSAPGTAPGGFMPGSNTAPGTSPGTGAAYNGSNTSQGTSPSMPGGSTNTSPGTSPSRSSGGTSTSQGTSSSLGGGGGSRTGSSSRSNP